MGVLYLSCDVFLYVCIRLGNVLFTDSGLSNQMSGSCRAEPYNSEAMIGCIVLYLCMGGVLSAVYTLVTVQ